MNAARKGARGALLRLRQWELDRLRKDLAGLEANRAGLVEEADRLEARLLVEQAHGGSDPLASLTYGAFAQKTKADRSAIDLQIEQIDGEISALRDRLAAAYLDLKQLELAEARRESRERQEAMAAEAASMDEAALQSFARRRRR